MKKALKGKKTYPSGLVVDYDKFSYNPELDKYANVVLFPEKVAKAKEAIKKPGFKELMASINNKETK